MDLSFKKLVALSLWSLLLFQASLGEARGECSANAMPQQALPGVVYPGGDPLIPPRVSVMAPACNQVTFLPTLRVRPQDVGSNSTIFVYAYLPSTQEGFLLQKAVEALSQTQPFDFFQEPLDFSGLSGLEAYFYYGYLGSDGSLVYDVYSLTVTEAMTSDYTPPVGSAQMDQGEGGVGPWSLRLRIATSDNGLDFTKTDRILTDQADVPDLVLGPNGWIYAYYVGWTMGSAQNRIGVAISFDGGENWIYKYVNIPEVGMDPPPVDPDVVVLGDGTFRIFFTYQGQGTTGPQTYYAEGTDGINFEFKGKAFGPGDIPVFDPSVSLIGDTWHLYAWSMHGVSTTGVDFEPAQDLILETSDGNWAIIANAIPAPGGYRAYCYAPERMDHLYSFFTRDGVVWSEEPGYRLTLEPGEIESELVKEPAVVQMRDGRFLMIYGTKIP